MEKYFEILKKSSLFNNIDTCDLSSMLSCMRAQVKEYGKRETVIAEGDKAKYVGIVLRGSLQIERTDYYGNRSIAGVVTASELFGESFACANVPEMPVSVVATENSLCLLIDCQRIISPCQSACAFHGKMIFNLLKIVATKNIMLNQKAEITSKRTTREKLMTYLMMQAKKEGSRSFTIPYDRQSLADFLEVERSGLSAEISKLRQEGVLLSRKNEFTLL